MFSAFKESNTKQYCINDFRGINTTSAAAVRELADSMNITNDDYPTLTVRKALGRLFQADGVAHMLAREDGIYFIRETSYKDSTQPTACTRASLLFYDYELGNVQEIVSDTDTVFAPKGSDIHIKQLASFGAYILIFGMYDGDNKIKKYFNTQSEEKTVKDTDVIWDNGETIKMTFTPCRIDGSVIESYTSSASAPSNPSDGDLWHDTTTGSTKQYSAAKGGWISVVTTYVKITVPDNANARKNLLDSLEQNDGVMFMTSVPELKKNIPEYNMIAAIDKDENYGYIVLTGSLGAEYTETEHQVQIRREISDFDYCFEHGGRLWGYSSENHEIYASAAGSAFNFSVYDGASYDSWATTIASDGDFTGGCSFGGYPFIFKSDRIYKIYGDYPSEFAVTEMKVAGCTDSRSIVQIDNVLYYKGLDGVYGMQVASYPTRVSDNIPNADFGVLGAKVGDSYMLLPEISLKNLDKHGYLYNTRYKTWHKNNLKAYAAVSFGGDVYFAVQGEIICFDNKEHDYIEGVIPFKIKTAPIGLDNPDLKTVSMVKVRYYADSTTRLRIYFIYDKSKIYEQVFTFAGNTNQLKSYEIPIIPRQCDCFQILFEGTGSFKLSSIAYNMR